MNTISVYEFWKYINEKNFAIYGSGYVGKKLYNILKSKNLLSNFECFISGEKSNNGTTIDGYKVLNLQQYKKYYSGRIFIAVHEANIKEIEIELINNNYKDYCWIFSILKELQYGKRLDTCIQVPLDVLWSKNIGNLHLAAKYAVIETMNGIRNDGDELYTYCMKFNTSEGTVKKRLANFKELIKKIAIEQYDDKSSISIFDNYQIIDGQHRFVIALIGMKKTISCDVYKTPLTDEKFLGKDAILVEEDIQDNSIRERLVGITESISKTFANWR